MNDKTGPVVQDTGHSIRVLPVFTTCKEAIENETRVWEGSRLQGAWKHSASVWSVSFSEVGHQDVVVTAIGLSVFVLVSKVNLWWMLESGPKCVEELIG